MKVVAHALEGGGDESEGGGEIEGVSDRGLGGVTSIRLRGQIGPDLG